MKPETIVVNWEIVTVDGGVQYGLKNFIYGIVKIDLKGRFQEGDYVFTTPLIDFDEVNSIGLTMNTVYKLEGPGNRYEITADDAWIMRNSGTSYRKLLTLKTNSKPKERQCSWRR